MLELDLKLTPRKFLTSAASAASLFGASVNLQAATGSDHWHLGIPGRPGTLELNERENRVWVKVHPLRDGGWATAVAHELSAKQSHVRLRRTCSPSWCDAAASGEARRR
jgi:hypothetical protein